MSFCRRFCRQLYTLVEVIDAALYVKNIIAHVPGRIRAEHRANRRIYISVRCHEVICCRLSSGWVNNIQAVNNLITI